MKHNILYLVMVITMSMLFTKLPQLAVGEKETYETEPANKPIVNPLKGWAPWIDDTLPEYPVSMMFVLWTWSEIEPQEGEYCFAQLEEKYHMTELREQGIRFIIRIVCDYPGRETHMDIPRWLYEKTYEDGDWYNISYGKGYAPNYSNPVFIQEHGELIQALGDYYASDKQVAYIELGSLGHWGEWHVKYSSGITEFPKSAVSDRYVQQYLSVFPSEKLLLRRPFDIGKEYMLGLYNDSFGQVKSHEEWLGWIAEGYVSEQTKEWLSGMPDFWEMAPSGGEFASIDDDAFYFSDGYESTMELLRQSHTTFIGPHCGANRKDPEFSEQILTMNREMGYCFQIKGASLIKRFWNFPMLLTIHLDNIGIAPIYENWMMVLRILDDKQNVIYEEEKDVSLNKILPGEHTIRITLPKLDLPAGTYDIEIGFIDHLTNRPGIALANKPCRTDELVYKVMEFSVH